ADRDLRLGSSKIRTKAEMNAESEREMARFLRPVAIDDELVRAMVAARIMVRRRIEGVHPFSSLDRLPSDLGIAQCAAQIALHRAIEAIAFLDCGIEQPLHVGEQARLGFGVSFEKMDEIRDADRGGAVTRAEQQADH